jgi:hypothetical protein
MNTYLKCNQMTLFETPTYITNLCYFQCLQTRIPSDWKTIRDKYIMWVTNAPGNMAKPTQEVEAHIKMLNSFEKLDFRFSV